MNELLVETGQSSNAIVDGTFGELAQRWLELSSPTLSPTTLHEYERLLDRLILPKFGKTKVRAIRAAEFDSSVPAWPDVGTRSSTARRTEHPSCPCPDPETSEPSGQVELDHGQPGHAIGSRAHGEVEVRRDAVRRERQSGTGCRLPATWDQLVAGFASGMGPPRLPVMGPP